jgi:hypothetical protein
MSTFIIVTVDILSSLFFLLLLWYIAIKPFVEEYFRLQIDRLEKFFIADAEQYPNLKPHIRKLRAFLRFIGNRPHLFSIIFLFSNDKKNLNSKTLDKITKHAESILDAMTQYETEHVNIANVKKMVQILLLILAWQNPLCYLIIKTSTFLLRINLQRILVRFYKYFINLKITNLTEQKNKTYSLSN